MRSVSQRGNVCNEAIPFIKSRYFWTSCNSRQQNSNHWDPQLIDILKFVLEA